MELRLPRPDLTALLSELSEGASRPGRVEIRSTERGGIAIQAIRYCEGAKSEDTVVIPRLLLTETRLPEVYFNDAIRRLRRSLQTHQDANTASLEELEAAETIHDRVFRPSNHAGE